MVLVLDQDLGAEQLVQARVAEERRWAQMRRDARSRSSTSASVGTCHSIVRSSVAERSVAGSRKSRVDPCPKQRQPVDGLVAEYEADVTIGNLAAPATHRGGGDLLPEQTVGDLDTVQSEGSDVEQQRPGSRL